MMKFNCLINILFSITSSFSLICSSSSTDENQVTVTVNESVLQVTDDRFAGVTLDSELIKDRWLNFNFSSEKLVNLAKSLSPCYLRIGGTAADCLIFDPEKIGMNTPWTNQQAEEQLVRGKCTKFQMSSADWDSLYKFTSQVGWDIIFDLNVLLRKNGHWDPSNAEVLLNYTASRGYKVAGFQLGNEPNSFHHVFDLTVNASDLAKDFVSLQKILQSYSEYRDSLIIGPDVTQVSVPHAKEYFEQFLATGGGKVVNRATFHQYYVDGRTASVDDFMDPTILDGLEKEIIDAVNITNIYSPQARVWLGETGSAYGGGAPGLSDAYVAGFMLLDKLGICAKYGVKGVLRQSLYKGDYSMLDKNTLNPYPDYWLTVLFKRLVGGPVFNVTSTVSTNIIRVYAHCTNTKSMYNYKPGSVTVYLLNLGRHSMRVSIPQFSGKDFHVYWLSSEKQHDLKSKKVKLNGKTLKLVNEKLPTMDPLHISSDQVNVAANTLGFIVIPSADVIACRKTYSVDTEPYI